MSGREVVAAQAYDPSIYRYEERGVWVTLAPDDIRACWDVGGRMRREAVAAGRKDLTPYTPEEEDKAVSIHAFGIMGEMAVAIVLGLPYEPRVGVYREQADIGRDIGVRTNDTAHYGLMIRGRDKDYLRMVQALTHEVPQKRPPRGEYLGGRLLVTGWLAVAEARRHDEWRQDLRNGREHAWMVPQSALRPLEEMPEVRYE